MINNGTAHTNANDATNENTNDHMVSYNKVMSTIQSLIDFEEAYYEILKNKYGEIDQMTENALSRYLALSTVEIMLRRKYGNVET